MLLLALPLCAPAFAEDVPKDKPADAPAAQSEAHATAEKPAAPTRSVAITEAQDFLGDWTLAIEAETEAIRRIALHIIDREGQLTATLKAPPPIGEINIQTIDRTAEGLKMGYTLKFGSQAFDIDLTVAIEGGLLKGQMADRGGLFEMPVKGAPQGQEDLLDSGGDSNNAAVSGRGGRARGEGFAETTVDGKKLTVQYGRPTTADRGPNRVPVGVAKGTIWPMGKEFATRLRTEARLKTAQGILEPGRYGLWARKTTDGWEILINAKPDVWMTQYDPMADLALIPLKSAKLEQPVEALTIELKPDSGAALLTLRWGNDELTGRIELAQ